jgi:D-3-phosphoglycerate dehydrogenase
MIGQVGTILGEYKINVAGMQVGRKEIGGNAVMVMAVDDIVPEIALEKMRKIDGIFDVRYVSL